jgi:hypothetical protein
MNAIDQALVSLRPLTLDAVLTALERKVSLTPATATAKRDLISAVQTTARLLGSHPAMIAVDIPSLRKRLLAIEPVQHRISKRRVSNIRSSLIKAFIVTRALPRPMPKAVPTDAWEAFLAQTDAKHQLWHLSRLVDFCVKRNIEPQAVSDAVIAEFEAFLDQTILTKDPSKIILAMTQTWNGIVKRRELSLQRLTIPSKDRYVTPPLTAYSLSLQADIGRYLDRLRHKDRFSRQGPDKPLKEISIRNVKAHLRQLLDAAVGSGCVFRVMAGRDFR